jgi:hypothetical protein
LAVMVLALVPALWPMMVVLDYHIHHLDIRHPDIYHWDIHFLPTFIIIST